MMIGTIVNSDPVMTRLWMASPPAVDAWAFQALRPTVSGYHVDSLSMMSGRK